MSRNGTVTTGTSRACLKYSDQCSILIFLHNVVELFYLFLCCCRLLVCAYCFCVIKFFWVNDAFNAGVDMKLKFNMEPAAGEEGFKQVRTWCCVVLCIKCLNNLHVCPWVSHGMDQWSCNLFHVSSLFLRHIAVIFWFELECHYDMVATH